MIRNSTLSGAVPGALLCAAAVALFAHRTGAQQSSDLARLQDEAVRRTREYLRINTTNPPGNEVETMRWFARIWARLKGGSQPALVLLHHMDAVPADPKYWSTDPLAAATVMAGKDSMIVGRGALDTKTLGIVELEA